MKNSSIYIIVPAFNEGKAIRAVVSELLAEEYSVVVVDDDSSDDTATALLGLPIYYLKHEVNLGQGAALQTGITYASALPDAEYFVTFDGDGQHRVADIGLLIAPLETGRADIVFGSRFLPRAFNNASLMRRGAIHLARFVNFLFSGVWLTDAHNGLRAFNRKTAGVLDLKENGMAHATEILFGVVRHQLRFTEVPVQVFYTPYSKKKGQSILGGIKIFLDLIFNRIFD